jgi:hypothetical protein
LENNIINWVINEIIRVKICPVDFALYLINYKFGKMTKSDLKILAPFFEENRHILVPFKDGVTNAVDKLSQTFDDGLYICSNSSYSKNADEKYREHLTEKFGNKFAGIELLPFTESKLKTYKKIDSSADLTFAIDDSEKNLLSAKKTHCLPVFVNEKKRNAYKNLSALADERPEIWRIWGK